jgi:SAM-dependent methyltransferase
MLAVLREFQPGLKLIGLEISRPSVAFIREQLDIESHFADLDEDSLDALIPPGTVDYVIFNEAYEHVRTPTVVVEKLLRMVRQGGRVRYSAQAYGPDIDLQIRVSEPIYIGARTLEWTLERTGAKLVDIHTSAKMYISLQKE